MRRGADHEVDLLVVGAGPAGGAAALDGARAGLRTLLVERREEVGRPVRCGEYVPAGIAREVAGIELPVSQRLPSLALHLPGGDRRVITAPGLMIDRDRFDRALADAAARAGAELWTGVRLVRLRRGGEAEMRRPDGAPLRVAARVVVGADGPRTTVGLETGLGRPRVMVGLGRRVSLGRPVGSAHLYFWSGCRFGYGWLFPKGSVANLGVAVPRGEARSARAAIAELGRRLEAEGLLADAGGQPLAAGLVPCGGPLPRLGSGRVLLVGDAAGQTDALSGAGILSALRAGALAARAAAEAIATGTEARAADRYEAAWRRAYGRHAARQLHLRAELEALWDRDLPRAVRSAWLGER